VPTTLRMLLTLIAATGLTLAFAQDSDFFNEADLIRDLGYMEMEAEGPADQPWIQAIDPTWVDTSQYATPGPWTVCFSNAGVDNPWRVVGFTTMEAQVDLQPDIGRFIHIDAEGSDNKQISDINGLLASGDCDILIVSPNTTAALTPVVETACQQLPVIVFDRGVNTDCPVSFITPIGGYAFGTSAADFIVDNLPEGGNVLALRILPGVDVLEFRWSGAERIFAEAGVNVVGAEFTEGSTANTKSIVEDYLQRFGQIDAIWMDAGATAVAAIEAFEDFGAPYPIITGEDQQDFLIKWRDEGLTALAPTFPTYHWRTPVIAA
jgi:ribose transport system substrate-binding protein